MRDSEGEEELLTYEPICQGENIEKHASNPLYPENYIHPHPEYQYLYGKQAKCLEIYFESPKFKKLHNKIVRKYGDKMRESNRHWLDYVKVKDIQGFGDCPHKIGYEKILAKDELDEHVMMYNVCPHTIFAAAKRQMKIAPKPDNKIADDFVKYSKDILEKYVGEELNQFGYDYQQWYNHNTAPKQKDIDRYYLAQTNPELFTNKELEQLETDEYTGICKVELQPEDGKPRMVCSIPIKTKITMGPVTWKLEEIMQEKFPGYCGGKNNDQMAIKLNEYIDAGFTKIVEGDGSAFDNTQDVTLKEIDRYLYRRVADKVYHVDKQQFLHISQQYYKKMSVNYLDKKRQHCMFKYKILGSVFSGDCDTTLCNTMRMSLYNLYVNEKEGLKYGKDFQLISKGDDFTVLYKNYISDKKINEIYYKYFLKAAPTTTTQYGLGQVLKMLNIGPPNTISFCSLLAWYKDIKSNHIILTRDIRKFDNLSLYSRKIKTLKGTARRDYLLQQAIATLTVYRGIKIFDTLADGYIYAATQVKTGNEKEFMHAIETNTELVRQMRMKIKTFNVLDFGEDTLRTLYNTQPRKETYKMIGNYWDTMKLLQENYTQNLTPQQLQYINEQTEKVMEIHYFKSRMGLSKLTCQQNKTIKLIRNSIISKLKQESLQTLSAK
jgi:hypothetical protein